MNVSIDAGTSQVSSERALVARVIRSNSWWFIAGLMIVGAYLRLANLGDLGIHSDEDISWITAKLILEKGVPEFPSGLMYMRGVAYLYITAASVMAFRAFRIRHTFARRVVRTATIPLAFVFARRLFGVAVGPVGSHTDHFFALGNRGRALRAHVCGVRFLRPADGSVHLGVSSTFGASRRRDPVRRAGHLQYHAARARIRDRSDVPDPTAPELGTRCATIPAS